MGVLLIVQKTPLHDLSERMAEVSTVALEPSSFRRVQVHRNGRPYRFLLRVCELVANQLLVDERTGRYRFSDFTRDEADMARLFEAFVRNFFEREQGAYRVRREWIAWDVAVEDTSQLKWLPGMQTETTLVSSDDCIVIEETFDRGRWGREVVRSGHLYQLFAYLRNLEARGGIYRHARGVLLYPAVDQAPQLRYVLQGHCVEVRTLNLAQPWRGIHNDLLAIAALRPA